MDFRFRNRIASLFVLPILFLAGCNTNEKTKEELFDCLNDPEELNNLAGYLPSQVVKWD